MGWHRVPSSSLCKSLKGSVLPIQVKAVEDRKDDSIDTADVYEANHRSGPPSYFYKAPLNNVGGSKLLPEGLRETHKRKQLWKVLLELLHHCRVRLEPSEAKLSEGFPSVFDTIC